MSICLIQVRLLLYFHLNYDSSVLDEVCSYWKNYKLYVNLLKIEPKVTLIR